MQDIVRDMVLTRCENEARDHALDWCSGDVPDEKRHDRYEGLVPLDIRHKSLCVWHEKDPIHMEISNTVQFIISHTK